MTKQRKRESKFTIDRDSSGELSQIDGPVQMAIIVPMITADENKTVPPLVLSECVRDDIERTLLKHGLLYRGIAVKIMKQNLPKDMKRELYELREHRDQIEKDRLEDINAESFASLGRVRKAWRTLWKG